MRSVVQRRLVPRGAIVKSSDARHDGGSAARSVATEEARCGQLCKLHTIATPEATNAQKIPPQQHQLVKRQRDLIKCVIKAQSSDFQLNEVDADGNIAVLHRAPRGRWRKVDRNQTFLVEDDSKEAFDDPSKSFSPRTMNSGKYVRRLGRVPERTPVLHFAMFRDSYTVPAVMNRLQYETRIQSDAVTFASGHSGFGCVTQHGTAIGVSEELLPHASRHYNLHALVFDPVRMCPLSDLPALHRPHRGNFFRLMLRCVQGSPAAIEEALQSIATFGFVNYFDVGRFTIASNHAHEIAAYASVSDFFHAVSFSVQSLAEQLPIHRSHFLTYLNASDATAAKAALERWASAAKSYKLDQRTVKFLEKLASVTDFSENSVELRNVWELHPHALSMRNSGAEFVWNAMASQRLLNHGLRVVVGDVVRVCSRTGRPLSSTVGGGEHGGMPSFLSHMEASIESFRRIDSSEDAKGFHISDVVLPIPYPGVADRQQQQAATELSTNRLMFPLARGVTRDDFVKFASLHRLDYLFDAAPAVTAVLDDFQQLRRVGLGTTPYRSLVSKPETLRYRVMHDPNSFAALKSDLFMLQERLPLQIISELDEQRIREPTVYNHSEAFAERMSSIRKLGGRAVSGEHSVVITGFLPRATDLSVMLREAFDVHHATYSDLLEPSWS